MVSVCNCLCYKYCVLFHAVFLVFLKSQCFAKSCENPEYNFDEMLYVPIISVDSIYVYYFAVVPLIIGLPPESQRFDTSVRKRGFHQLMLFTAFCLNMVNLQLTAT